MRRLDDSTYVVYYDGDLFRAYHSDVMTSIERRPCCSNKSKPNDSEIVNTYASHFVAALRCE